MSMFDYIKYDENAQVLQEQFKADFTTITFRLDNLRDGRAKALAITKLEEAYMWIGKSIRDEQIVRNGSAELQEERGEQ